MADNNNRRRGRSSGYSDNGEFNWEEYDRLTSHDLDARERGKRAEARRAAEDAEEAYPSRRRTASKARKKKQKKQRSEKSLRFRRRLRLAIFIIILIAAVILGGMAAGMYAAVSREISDMNIKGLASNYSSFIYYTDDFGQPQELEQINSDEFTQK